MTEKIQALFEELAKECEKQEVSHVLMVNKDKVETDVEVQVGGDKLDLAIMVKNLEDSLVEKFKSCGCESCQELLTLFTGKEPDHTFVIESERDLEDVFNRIALGDY